MQEINTFNLQNLKANFCLNYFNPAKLNSFLGESFIDSQKNKQKASREENQI